MTAPGLRIGDAERDRATADLAEHYAQGRLSHDEHGERLDAIWTARTAADLEVLFEDLPRLQPVPTPARRPAGRRWPGLRGLPLVPVLVVLVALSAITHLPFWVLILFLACGSGARAHRGHLAGAPGLPAARRSG